MYVNRGTVFSQTPGGPFGSPSLQIGGARLTKEAAGGDQAVRPNPVTGRRGVLMIIVDSIFFNFVGDRTRLGRHEFGAGVRNVLLPSQTFSRESTLHGPDQAVAPSKRCRVRNVHKLCQSNKLILGRTRPWRLSSGAGSGSSMDSQLYSQELTIIME